MLKKLFKKKEVKRKEKLTASDISSPISLTAAQDKSTGPGDSYEAVDVSTTAPSSIGVQAEFSPARARPSLLVSDNLINDGYSTVYDAIDNQPSASKKKNKSRPLPRSPSSNEQLNNSSIVPQHVDSVSSLTSVTSDEEELKDPVVVIKRDTTNNRKEEQINNEVHLPIYAKVKKEVKINESGKIVKKVPKKDEGINSKGFKIQEKKEMSPEVSREKKHINAKRHIKQQMEYQEELEEDTYSSEDLPLDYIDLDHSLPSHLPPPSPSPKSKRKDHHHHHHSSQRITPHPQLVDTLPVYSLSQSLPTPSGDQAYLLTRTGPDGKLEHFTATVISPTATQPGPYYLSNKGTRSLPSSPLKPDQPHPSSSIPFLATSTPSPSIATNLHQPIQQPNLFPYNEQMLPVHQPLAGFVPLVSPAAVAAKGSQKLNKSGQKQKRPSSQSGLSVSKSTQTVLEEEQERSNFVSLHNENMALKESLTQITSELSIHSLNDENDEVDLSMEGVPLEQLVKDLPQRLHKALKTLNQSVAEKQIHLQTHETEMNKLRKKYDELKQINKKLTEASIEQQETILKEKSSFEQSLSEIKAEKDDLMQMLATRKSKHKQTKLEHKIKVTKLTSDLHKLTSERDSIKDELLTIQQSHSKLQKFLKQQNNPTQVATIPLEEHKKSLKEFENLIQDIMHSSRGHIQSSHKLNALKSENLSLMAEIARANAELLSIKKDSSVLKRENKDYEERLLKLQTELKDARIRELTVVNELTQAVRNSDLPMSNKYKLGQYRSSERFNND